jgi:predicted dehydrogenase
MKTNKSGLTRRRFIKTSAGAGLYIAAAGYGTSAASCASQRPARIGFVGVGGRGMGMLRVALSIEGVEVTAVCDIVKEKVERAQRLVEEAGQPKPQGFTGPEDYKRLAELKNLDAVYTATPIDLHTPIMLAALRAGKYGGTEMPACTEYDQASELVEASEKSGKPCMLMENYVYMRNVKMILVMNRLGMFGDLTHCECGYQHDARYAGFGPKGEMLWRALGGKVNNNPYPTHAIGPIAQWLNINRGKTTMPPKSSVPIIRQQR